MTKETTTINGKEYHLYINYQNDEKLRKEFNHLTQAFWKFDYEAFYESGFWDDTYILYSLFDQDKIVSHSTVTLFQTQIKAETKTLLQLGTVMTDQHYQKQGLSRFLMERISSDFRDTTAGIFLFANDTVLDFYPKFGFAALPEYQAHKEFNIEKQDQIAREKLNLNHPEHLQLVKDLVQYSVPCSAFPMDNYGMIFFYCYIYPKFGFTNTLYYIEALKTIVAAQIEENTLIILHVFSKNEVPLNEILKAFADQDLTSVKLGFSPKETGFQYSSHKEEDLTLFVSEELLPLFQHNKYMVPILSHT